MAATVDSTTQNFGGIGGHAALKVVRLDLGTYATGGVDLTAAILGVGAIVDVLPFPAGGYVPVWDGEEILVYFGDNNNASDGPLIEIATDTNLAAVSFPALVIYRP